MKKTALLFFAATIAASAQMWQLPLMPWPASLQPASGMLTIDEHFSITATGAADERVSSAISRLYNRLSAQTGMTMLIPGEPPAHAVLTIECRAAGKPVQANGEDESYRLVVDPGGARLAAPNALGVIHGLETFLQLVTPGPDCWFVPALTIDDSPRFPWRGLMIDASRHFIPLSVIWRELDAMAAVKMNVLHWHLSDDQGFRVESRRYPRLHELGSNGQYYTQDQIRATIAYARNRGIRIVPEFDMPGHATSWFVGYPELAANPGPYQIGDDWGVHDACMDPTRDTTYEFLDNFIGEMTQLFPDAYFHIGGDEVNGKAWAQSEAIQAWMREHNIADKHALQAYFNGRVQAIVTKHGKRMEGWDEILDPNLPKDIVIQSWRGQKSLAAAAEQGYQGILSSGYYLDLMFPASKHYAVDPMEGETANLTPEQRKLILGGEAAEWTEYASPEIIDQRIWPRNAAIAERLWSPQNVRDVGNMYFRLEPVSQWLGFTGITHRTVYQPMLDRLAAGQDTRPLRVLADVVEPVKEYAREELMHNTQQTPLVRLIDTCRPESDVARQFGTLVHGTITKNMWRYDVRYWLTLWRDNDTYLSPMLQRSFLLHDAIPVSQNLSAIARVGLDALDAIESGTARGEEWRAQQMQIIADANKPGAAGVLISIAEPVQQLVQAVK